jgi:tRNA A37 threonylcarbamoyladenosine synthetase subunit TsaC/SUA5/YrdC
MTTTTAVTSAARMPKQAEPVKLQKRIGSTVYTVSIRFSEKQTETLEDIILRLIERDVRKSA